MEGRKGTIVLLLVILIAWLPFFIGAWDKGEPVEGGLAPDLNNVIRTNNDALEVALDAWMYFATGGTQTGQPRQGSGRPYFQDAVPTTRLDSDYFDSTDLGCIWIDSNATIDNQFNILTAADGAGTETWTPISTEIIAVLLASARVFAGTLGVTGNFAVNTDKFTVAAASGNTAIAGTLDVGGSTAIDETLDEDDLTSDSDTALATQQSIKAYIDGLIAAVVPDDDAFGTWTDKDSGGSTALAKDEVYKVGSDGFVCVRGTAGQCKGYTDGSNPPTTQITAYNSASYGGSFCLPVKKDDYWKVTIASGTLIINWLPIGSGTCVKQ